MDKWILYLLDIFFFQFFIITTIIYMLVTLYSDSHYSSVQSLSHVWLCDPMDCSMPGLPVHQNSLSLLKLMSITSVMPYNHLILCCPLLFLPSIFPSIRVFSNESILHIRWPKYGSFSNSPSKEYSRLISFRMDWLDLLEIQGAIKSLLSTTIRKHQFFGTQLSSWSSYHTHTWLMEKP